MGMGAASSSRCFVRPPLLSCRGVLAVEKWGQGGRAAVQAGGSIKVGGGHVSVATPPAVRARGIAASAFVRHGCLGGAPWGLSVGIVRCRTWFSASQPGPLLGTSFDSFQTQALAVEAAQVEESAPAEASLQDSGRGPAVDWEVGRWVVFSDLHLSRRTLDICLQTLRQVHAEAAARNAGILFLGDFWHERGALPVEPLNQVLQVIQAWQRPTLMIPGNHDQVSIGGEVHSLTPLAAASPFIRVLHEPSVVQGALFVPYRRDHQLVLDAMQAHPDVKAVFAHIDVAGAYLNNSFQAKDGIAPAALRKDVPIYTGHYHRPHTVDGTSVRYVGSPYQVSRSEAGQQKHLLVLDQDWQEEEVIPLSVGPRHFSVSGATPDLPEDLRAGDRLRWEVPAEWALLAKQARPSAKAAPHPVADTLADLRRRGVEVEVVYPLPASTPRIQKAEELDAFSLFSQYAATVGLSPPALARGHALLRELDLPARALRRPRADVVFRRLELEGYGPFLARTEYCLGPARGLRAITGSIQDGGQGSDSNGAGKTTLVMAPLWALTGSTDARPGAEGGLLLGEVVHPEAASARVRLEGDVNGRPFTVERTAGRRSGLRFEVDGEDRTQQEMRLTQDKINDLLDTASLRRIAFHGQHAVGGLLEANDRELKEELSRMVSMEVWVAAAEACKRLLKQQRTHVEHLHGAAAELRNRTAALEAEIERTESEQRQFEQWKAAQASQLDGQLAATRSQQATALQRCLESAVRLDACIAATAGLLTDWEDAALGDVLGPPGAGHYAAGVSAEEEEAAALAQDAQMELVDKRAQARSAAAAVEAARARLASFTAANAEAVVCERCLQPVTGEHLAASVAAMRSDLQHEQARLEQLRQEEAEMEAVLEGVRSILEDLRTTRRQHEARRRSDDEQRRAAARQERQELQQARSRLAAAERERDDARGLDVATFDALRRSTPAGGLAEDAAGQPSAPSKRTPIADRARASLDELQQATSAVREGHHAAVAAEAAVGELERRQEEVAGKQDPHAAQRDTLARMHADAQAELAAREAAIGTGEAEVGVLRAVEAAVGLAGIQSFVLEGALAELEARTAALLDTLSGGTLALHLAATRVGKTTKREQEKIDKVVRVQLGDGRVVDRSVRQLSGGERQRVAVALQLAFADFAAERSGVHSDLVVLDEAFQHLDTAGRSRMLAVLRGLAAGSVLVVSQANGELAGMFDLVDTVVRDARTATVVVT